MDSIHLLDFFPRETTFVTSCLLTCKSLSLKGYIKKEEFAPLSSDKGSTLRRKHLLLREGDYFFKIRSLFKRKTKINWTELPSLKMYHLHAKASSYMKYF